MPDRIGQQLGNYRLLRLLGRGGFAEVYLGEHLYLKRRAALKVLRASLEDEEIGQFLSEAQTLARLDHPNIVRVLDFAVEQDGTPFLVMDYAPRGTLLQRHPRGSCLSLETTVTYVKQVAAALQYAHNHHVIHRDIKPGNMLLGAQPQVMLSDFGIALFSPSPEQLSTQGKAGTIPYMSPEQLRGKPTFASDQYALGIVVYEWLCGARPFEGEAWRVAYQHVSVPPPRLREKDPSLSEAVEAVVLKALSKDSQDRYVSVQQFAQALEKASAVAPLEVRSDSEVTAPLGPISPATPLTPTATPKRVFLSASRADDALVVRLTADLQQRGITAWHQDPDSTQNSLDQEDAVRQAIRAVEVMLVLISPNAHSSRTIKEHLHIASLYQRRLVFVWVAGEDIADVLPQEWGKAAQVDLIDARELRYEQALDEIVVHLAEDETPQAESVLPGPEFEPRNPYKGLRPFTKNDAADFFGRESLIQELVDRVKGLFTPGHPRLPTARLLAVIGASGSGKSSVIMAGLLPRLERGALPGSQQWIYLEPMVPGTHPVEALALTLAPRFPDRSVKSMCEDLEDASARGLHLLATQLVKAPGQQVVLFVDQFEELFLLTTSQEERQHFIDLLITSMIEPQGPVIVLLTLRADFYDRPIAYPALHQLIETHQKTVLPMTLQDLRAVIKGPATLPDVQLSFEGSLVGDLLFEVQGQVGALPLLQFTLEQLFERRSEHTLTLKAYRQIGGVKGALSQHAEKTYAALLSEEHRRLARALFVRLIDPGASEQDTTRRRALLSEFVLADATQTRLLRETMDAFIAARLLTTNEVAGTTTIEVSHEALIREWRRLAAWMREARKDISLQQTISRDVAEWEQRSKPNDRLYRGSQLKEARTWAQRNMASSTEVAFLQASATRRMRSRIGVTAIVLLVLLLSIPAGVLVRSVFLSTVVTTPNDNGPGSLRWAIANTPSGGTITFDKSVWGHTILLTKDLQIAKKSLSIQGPGADLLTISTSTYHVAVSSNVSLSIFALTFRGSKFNSRFVMSNSGTLTLTNSTISGNSGGGINNVGGTLTLTNSTISGNSGGGIFNSGGTLILINSAVLGNMTSERNIYGGGIYNQYGKLTLQNSIVSGNTASRGSGGGIFTINSTLTLISSTISGNTSFSDGGGIANVDSALTLTNSTISGNTASNYDGGGIFNLGGQAGITFCTIYGNTAKGLGGGIASEDDQNINPPRPGQLLMRNSFVASNRAHSGPDIAGTLTTYGYNLVQNTSGATFIDPNKQHSTDISADQFPSLGIDPILRDNGGLTTPHTFTYALFPGSPAIDRIPADACLINDITTDQRGVKRPDDNESVCDIGAYESSP